VLRWRVGQRNYVHSITNDFRILWIQRFGAHEFSDRELAKRVRRFAGGKEAVAIVHVTRRAKRKEVRG
jgi:hypothetical protein